MVARIIDDKDPWDKFIDSSPYGMLFHKWDLLKIIERHTGYSLHTYGLYKNDELFGVIPVFFKNVKGVKLTYSPPQGTLVYIPYMGWVMSRDYAGFKQHKKESYLDIAWADIAGELKKLSANFTSITFVPELNDVRPFLWDHYDIELRYTYVIDLQKPAEALWEGLERGCRKSINAGAKNGLHIVQNNDADLFIATMAESLKGQGNTFFRRQSPEYLKDLLAAYPQNLKMYFLYRDTDIVGMAVNCEYKDLCLGWLGDAVIDRGIISNEYFNWELIKMAKEAGFKRFEIWGADMKRLNQFKSKFGPELVPYYHVRKKDTVGRLSEWAYGQLSANPGLGLIRNMIR